MDGRCAHFRERDTRRAQRERVYRQAGSVADRGDPESFRFHVSLPPVWRRTRTFDRNRKPKVRFSILGAPVDPECTVFNPRAPRVETRMFGFRPRRAEVKIESSVFDVCMQKRKSNLRRSIRALGNEN